MNVYSELVQAQLENLSSNPTPGVPGRVIFNTVTKSAHLDNGVSYERIVNGTVGEVKMAKLSEAQFQEDYGTDWVLEDGRTLTNATANYPKLKARRPEWYNAGTDTITLVDARAMFLRGGNEGRDDAYADPEGGRNGFKNIQNSNLPNHHHGIPTFNATLASGGINVAVPAMTDGVFKTVGTGGTSSEGVHPNNITVNFFIKVK